MKINFNLTMNIEDFGDSTKAEMIEEVENQIKQGLFAVGWSEDEFDLILNEVQN